MVLGAGLTRSPATQQLQDLGVQELMASADLERPEGATLSHMAAAPGSP